MTRVLHLVVGPDDDGVVRHGCEVAGACGHELIQVRSPAEVTPALLAGADVVHLPFTDRLFGRPCEESPPAVRAIAEAARAVGAEISLTLHDVPHGTDALAVSRRAAYRDVIAMARGVVVNSLIELGLVEDDARRIHSLRRIDLPVESARDEPRVDPAAGYGRSDDAVVLGFVFPDRGYEAVLSALPAGGRLVALGGAAVGHSDLPGELDRFARRIGRRLEVTGFVADADLPGRLRGAGVPIAPNQRVTASGSIATWLAHGRRPLVPDMPYTRELARRMPGSLSLYDPRSTGGLADALARARADPASTWLDAGTVLGPTMADVAAAYVEHLDACRPARVSSDGSGHARVPGNRWDLLAPAGAPLPRISVVIPYFSAPLALARLLATLAAQTVASIVDVVVADDGSPVPPNVSGCTLPVRVVRQERRGFGAARARNLGASVATGQVLAFLDVDMVPEPEYLERLVRLPAEHPDCLTVGRRRHAELDGWTPSELGQWFRGGAPRPVELPEPRWLSEAYHDSGDLLHADHRSYRYVISAVLAMSKSMFERLGGFHEGFDAYGGEDWELAHRAWTAGALFAHVRDAVAWHDGPDRAGRDVEERRAAENTEVVQTSRLIPDPQERGGGQWMPYVSAIVQMAGDDLAAVLATARSAFAAGADCGFWLTGPNATDTATRLADPRIHAGDPPDDVRARAGVIVEMTAPSDLSELDRLVAIAHELGVVVTPAARARSLRAGNRSGGDDRLAAVMFGRHDRTTPVPFGDLDLGRVLRGQSG